MSGDYIPTLPDQSDSTTRGLCVREELGYFSAHSIEKRNRRLAVNNFFRIANNYRVGKVSLRSLVRSRRGVFDLVFRADPSAVENRIGTRVAFPDGGTPEAHGYENGVLLDVGHVVYGPEGVIPSLVWAAPFKDRDDFGGEILFRAVYPVGPAGEVLGERKVGPALTLPPMLGGDGMNHLVETGPQIIDGIKYDAGNIIREGFIEYIKMGLGPICVVIDKVGVWLIGGKNTDLGFEICDMVICATENAFRAGEDISHD